MASKRSKKNIKIFGATTIALFSLVTVFTATVAWFALNKKTDSSGSKIKAQDVSGRLNQINVHPLIGFVNKEVDGKTVPFYSFTREPTTIFGEGSEETVPSFNLGEYDPLNTDHPLLIIFVLSQEIKSTVANDIYIKGSTETDGFLGATDGGEPVYDLGRGTELCTTINNVDYYPLSSAVNFKCAHYSEAAYTSLLSASASNAIDIATGSVKLKESFVNFASSGADITFKQKPLIYSSPGGNTLIKYIAMVVNYDSNAVSAIYSTFLGNEILESEDYYGGKLNFTCDWSLEVF